MPSELGKAEFYHLLPLLHYFPRDPVLHSALEGNRPGQVFVDRPSNSSVALIWTGMEYAYLIGEPAGYGAEVVQVVEELILPILEEARSDLHDLCPWRVAGRCAGLVPQAPAGKLWRQLVHLRARWVRDAAPPGQAVAAGL